jgi:hypothetical protein
MVVDGRIFRAADITFKFNFLDFGLGVFFIDDIWLSFVSCHLLRLNLIPDRDVSNLLSLSSDVICLSLLLPSSTTDPENVFCYFEVMLWYHFITHLVGYILICGLYHMLLLCCLYVVFFHMYLKNNTYQVHQCFLFQICH